MIGYLGSHFAVHLSLVRSSRFAFYNDPTSTFTCQPHSFVQQYQIVTCILARHKISGVYPPSLCIGTVFFMQVFELNYFCCNTYSDWWTDGGLTIQLKQIWFQCVRDQMWLTAHIWLHHHGSEGPGSIAGTCMVKQAIHPSRVSKFVAEHQVK